MVVNIHDRSHDDDGGTLVCHITDPDESKEGAETSEIRITCNPDQVIGDLAQLQLPVGMKDLRLSETKVAGTLVTLPPSIKVFNITDTGVKIDMAAIEWPANATALVHEDGALVCHATDSDESKEGAETSEIRIKCATNQVIGTSSIVARMNDHYI